MHDIWRGVYIYQMKYVNRWDWYYVSESIDPISYHILNENEVIQLPAFQKLLTYNL